MLCKSISPSQQKFKKMNCISKFVLETEAPQYDRMTATGQDTDNKNNNIQIFKIDNVQK